MEFAATKSLTHPALQKVYMGNNMTSIDDRAMVDEIIAANGDQDTTHIIEYQNMHDGRTAWKLCRSKAMYTYAMETGSFIEPKLIWTQNQTTDSSKSDI